MAIVLFDCATRAIPEASPMGGAVVLLSIYARPDDWLP